MNKTTILILIVLVLGGFFYFYVMGDNVPASGTLQGTSAQLPDNAAAEVLALLHQIEQLEIDPTIFELPVYRTLVDYAVPIPPQPVGRVNPFAPVR